MDSELKVSIYKDPCFGGVQIMVYSRNGDKNVVWQFDKPRLIEVGEYEALDAEGVKTDSDAKIQGVLEATKAHLKDLQALVFKYEPVTIVDKNETVEQLLKSDKVSFTARTKVDSRGS